MAQVVASGDCSVWTGSCTKDGYGVMGIGRAQQHRVHRAAYQEFIGPIPHGMLVCHSCDNPKCINPAHLFLGTARDNTQDMLRKGRGNRLRGDDHPNRKIPVSEIPRIVALRRSGQTLLAIGREYGVSFQRISEICLEASRASAN